MITLKELKEKLESVGQVIAEWETLPADQSPLVKWRGVDRLSVSEALITAWEGLIEFCDRPDFEPAAKPIVLAVDKFEKILAQWGESLEIDALNTDPNGSTELWHAWRTIFETKPPRIVYPDSIKTLIEVQSVSDRQIALQYGFADVRMVREEYENPGTHYDKKTWTPPSYRKATAEVEKQWSERSTRYRVQATVKKQKRVAPESLDELIAQNVPSQQIARMKGLTVDEIRERADFLGLPLDGQAVSLPMNPVDKLAEVRKQEDAARMRAADAGKRGPHPEIENILERVAACAADGMKPGEIAQAFRGEIPGINGAKVAKMLESAKV